MHACMYSRVCVCVRVCGVVGLCLSGCPVCLFICLCVSLSVCLCLSASSRDKPCTCSHLVMTFIAMLICLTVLSMLLFVTTCLCVTRLAVTPTPYKRWWQGKTWWLRWRQTRRQPTLNCTGRHSRTCTHEALKLEGPSVLLHTGMDRCTRFAIFV